MVRCHHAGALDTLRELEEEERLKLLGVLARDGSAAVGGSCGNAKGRSCAAGGGVSGAAALTKAEKARAAADDLASLRKLRDMRAALWSMQLEASSFVANMLLLLQARACDSHLLRNPFSCVLVWQLHAPHVARPVA